MSKKQKESGLYAFFQYDYKEDVYILTTGKTEDKIEREKDYQTTNSNITFDFFKPVKINFLSSEESKFQKNLHKSGLEYWKNSTEQFVVGKTKEHMLQVENLILETLEKVKSQSRDVKNIQYKYPVLFDEYGNLTDGTFVEDIRDKRKKCDLIPGEEAMIVNKAGINERTRKYLTKYRKEGRRLVECKPHYINVSNKAWDIIQIVQKNERYGKENII